MTRLSATLELLPACFQDIAELRVGMKTKTEKSNPEPKPEDINKKWNDIRLIKTFEKYQNERHGVFWSNIERGAEFLKTPISILF